MTHFWVQSWSTHFIYCCWSPMWDSEHIRIISVLTIGNNQNKRSEIRQETPVNCVKRAGVTDTNCWTVGHSIVGQRGRCQHLRHSRYRVYAPSAISQKPPRYRVLEPSAISQKSPRYRVLAPSAIIQISPTYRGHAHSATSHISPL